MFEEAREKLKKRPSPKDMTVDEAKAQLEELKLGIAAAKDLQRVRDSEIVGIELMYNPNKNSLRYNDDLMGILPLGASSPAQRRDRINIIIRKFDRLAWENIILYAYETYLGEVSAWESTHYSQTFPIPVVVQVPPDNIPVSSELFDPQKRERQRWIDDRIWELRTFERQYALPETPIYRIGLIQCFYTVLAEEARAALCKKSAKIAAKIDDVAIDNYIISHNPNGFYLFT